MHIPLGSSTEDIKSEKMIFAKALCVVLLLYSTSFGDSLSLKNDTDSESRTVIKLPPPPHFKQNPNDVLRTKKMLNLPTRKPHAEDYRGFLLYLLREVWNKHPYNVDKAAETLTGHGLYFIFWSAYEDADDVNTQDQIYPLYVGITRRTFKKRFKEHIDDGVVKKIRSGQWPKQKGITNLRLIVYTVDMPLPVAKFFESVFLYTFDFAMNSDENEGEREGIQITKSQSVSAGYYTFKGGYEYIKAYFTDVDKVISHEAMESEVNQMFHYNFKA